MLLPHLADVVVERVEQTAAGLQVRAGGVRSRSAWRAALASPATTT
jgi:hypothetical protein